MLRQGTIIPDVTLGDMNFSDIFICHLDSNSEAEDSDDEEKLFKQKLKLRGMVAPGEANKDLSKSIKCPLCYFEIGDIALLQQHMKVRFQSNVCPVYSRRLDIKLRWCSNY